MEQEVLAQAAKSLADPDDACRWWAGQVLHSQAAQTLGAPLIDEGLTGSG